MTNTFHVADPYEAIALEIYDLDRAALIEQLTHFDGPFPLDFDAAYLAQKTTDQLRHILLAARWRTCTRDADA